MNSKNNELIEAIFNGELDIAVFTINNEQYFIFDNKENYTIDVKPFYDRYFKNGIINLDQYNRSLSEYRGGIIELTKKNLFSYFNTLNISPKKADWMKKFFMDGYSIQKLEEIYFYIENYLASSNDVISIQDWDILEARLPKFYINLDRNIFMHTYWNREFENELPSYWRGETSSRFWSLIPDRDSYWQIDNMNFWKLYG